MRPDIHSYAYKGYVILYRYGEDVLEVVNVIEGHRDITTYFRDLPEKS